MSKQHEEHNDRYKDLKEGEERPPFKVEKTAERKNWEKINKKITSELSKLRQRVSAANIYKLFMSSLYQTYWHTYFRDPKKHKKVYN